MNFVSNNKDSIPEELLLEKQTIRRESKQ